jgi:outer membrane protein OmpA-like peptidoglycan-associated protein
MSTTTRTPIASGKKFLGVCATTVVIAACAGLPPSPDGAAEARAKLTQLQSDANLANQVPVALKEAEDAVRLAEEPVGRDTELGEHRVFMADRKVEIAMARASTRYAEQQRSALAEERGQSRLDARTQEADKAHDATAELQRQLDELKAQPTDRGLVLTLGDLMFAFDRADIKPGGTATLDRLVTFLNQYPDRGVAIEGHTDNVGSSDYNYRLSQRRADAVKSYLVQQGIASQRLTATGKGKDSPLASNDSDSGREQNRRVELIIDNPTVAPAAAS